QNSPPLLRVSTPSPRQSFSAVATPSPKTPFHGSTVEINSLPQKRTIVARGWFPTIYGDTPPSVLCNRMLHVVWNKKPSIDDFYDKSARWLNANKDILSEIVDPE